MPSFIDNTMDLVINVAIIKNDIKYIKNSLDKYYKSIYKSIKFIHSKEMFDIIFSNKSILNIININDNKVKSILLTLNKKYNNILLAYMLEKDTSYEKLKLSLMEDFKNSKSAKEKYKLLKIMKLYKYIENDSKNYTYSNIEIF